MIQLTTLVQFTELQNLQNLLQAWEGGGSNLKRQAQNFLSLKWNFHLSVFFPFKAAYPNDSQIVKLSKKWESESVKSELFGGSRCPVSFSCLSTHTTLLLTSGHCFQHRLSFVSFLKISNRVGIVVGMFLGWWTAIGLLSAFLILKMLLTYCEFVWNSIWIWKQSILNESIGLMLSDSFWVFFSYK